MPEYDNTNSGAMFKNERKNSPNHPDRTGSLEVKCPHCEEVSDFWLSGWIKKAKKGKRAGQQFLSVAITPKDDQQQSNDHGAPADDFDDDIPF